MKRVETLDAKEKALAAKEAELKRWEADLRATGNLKPKKNWPFRFFPILHHDIAAVVEDPPTPPPPPNAPAPCCMFAEVNRKLAMLSASLMSVIRVTSCGVC